MNMKLRQLHLFWAFLSGMAFAFLISAFATTTYLEDIINFYKNGFENGKTFLEPLNPQNHELSRDFSDLRIPRSGMLRTIQHNDILFQAVSRSISENDRNQR